MRREAFRWAVRGVGMTAGVVAVLAVLQVALSAGSVLLLVFGAVLLASALEPLVGWLRSRLPINRAMTILLVYAGFIVTVVGIALLVVPAAINQLGDLAAELPPFLDEARQWASALEPRPLSSSVTALIDAAADLLTPAPPNPDDVVEAGLTVAEVVGGLVTMLAIVFFWLTEHARLQRYALSFVPARRRGGVREAWNEVEARLGGWVRGQLVLMGTIAAATFAVYSIVGLPSALLLALVAGIGELIPLVGPIVGGIPAILVAAAVNPELVPIVAIAYLVIQFVEGNVLIPVVMRNTIGISPFLVLTSLLVGAAAGGVLGAIVAVPLVATIEVILERLQARRVPVAQDPTAQPDERTREAQGETLSQA